METTRPDSLRKKNLRAAGLAGVLAVGMVGLAYAAVPLYRIFCQITGYGGTTQQAESSSETVVDRVIVVRFDSNVAPGLKWAFKPVQRQVELKVGENSLAFYEARNIGTQRITGTSTFNVTPLAAGQYFNKVQCFCFTEQSLEPGEKVEMPVSFFIDPDIVKDPDLKTLKTITLSYTFFPMQARSRGKPSKTGTGRLASRTD